MNVSVQTGAVIKALGFGFFGVFLVLLQFLWGLSSLTRD